MTLDDRLLRHAPDHPPALSRWRAPGLALLFCVLLLLFARWIVAPIVDGAPEPWTWATTEKRDHWERSSDDYDVVFLGSSRVFRGIVPAVVDAELARLDLHARTFNYGVPGLSLAEFDGIVERIVARRGERLRLVILEPNLRTRVLGLGNIASDREVATHTRDATRVAIHREWSDPGAPLTKRLWNCALHVAPFALRELEYGAAARRYFDDAPRPPPERVASATDAGYQSLESETMSRIVAANARFRVNQERFGGLPNAARRERFAAMQAHDIAHLESVVGRFHAAGIEVALVLMPDLSRADRATLYERRMVALRRQVTAGVWRNVPVLDYLDPTGPLADLRKPDAWFDHQHLGAAASRTLSRRVAEDLSQLLRRDR